MDVSKIKGGRTLRQTMRTNEQIAAIYERNADSVYRVCMLFFRGRVQDAEDALQTTFLKLLGSPTRFDSPSHERAWLIVTASNTCRDMLASGWSKRVSADEERVLAQAAPLQTDETLKSVMALPERYKAAIYLYYYEGYSCREIARYMKKTVNSVWGYLHEGRRLLKAAIKEGDDFAE